MRALILAAFAAYAAAQSPAGSVNKGSYFVFEQTEVNGEVWLPSYSEFHLDARILLFKARANGILRFTDYKKYDAASKIVAVEP